MDTNKVIDNTWFIIMAGGIGSRFWPASRESQPKQFLDIMGTGRSLIQMTWDRIKPLVPADRVIVMTNKRYRDQVAAHLPGMPRNNILTEPSRQNTAPCIAYVCFYIEARQPDANIVVLPADHLISREEKFRIVLAQGVDYVTQHPAMLTLGMTPHRPDTGYGYIQLGAETSIRHIFHVTAFREKPSLEVARKYLSSENFVWNGGIFVSAVHTMLKAFERYAPDIYNTLHAPDIYGSSGESVFIEQRYPATPSISIDYAIMEKANNIVCFAVDIGWSDIGTWKSLYDIRKKETEDVVINTPPEESEILDSKSLMIHAEAGKKVLIRGLKNMLIVDSEDILMIWPLEVEQEIKEIREDLAPKWDLE